VRSTAGRVATWIGKSQHIGKALTAALIHLGLGLDILDRWVRATGYRATRYLFLSLRSFEPYNPIGEYGLSKTQDKGYRSLTIGLNSTLAFL
jgi:hypothetical protein